MRGIVNQNKGLLGSGLTPLVGANLVRRRSPPGILLAVNDCYARVREVGAAKTVDDVDIGRRVDAKGAITAAGSVLDGDGTGEEALNVLGGA